MISVTFDANTFQILCGNEPSYPNTECIELVRTALQNKRITGFLSESVLTYEMIKRKDRKQFLADYQAEYVDKVEGNKISFGIGPNRKVHPGIPEQGKYRLDWMDKLGIKLLKIYRTAIFAIDGLEQYAAPFTNQIHDTFCKVVRQIEPMSPGLGKLEAIGNKYDSEDWLSGLDQASPTETKQITSALGEWSDSDSIATHIAHKIDYFCTNDLAKEAGEDSIFGATNRKYLTDTYGVKFLSFDELCALLKQ